MLLCVVHWAGVLRDQIDHADWQHTRAPQLFHWNRRLAPDSAAWAAKVDLMLETLERTRGVVREQGGADKMLLEDAASLLAGARDRDRTPPSRGGRSSTRDWRWVCSAGGDPETAAYVRRLLDGEPVFESCLVDTWVGEGRYAWVDLRYDAKPRPPLALLGRLQLALGGGEAKRVAVRGPWRGVRWWAEPACASGTRCRPWNSPSGTCRRWRTTAPSSQTCWRPSWRRGVWTTTRCVHRRRMRSSR